MLQYKPQGPGFIYFHISCTTSFFLVDSWSQSTRGKWDGWVKLIWQILCPAWIFKKKIIVSSWLLKELLYNRILASLSKLVSSSWDSPKALKFLTPSFTGLNVGSQLVPLSLRSSCSGGFTSSTLGCWGQLRSYCSGGWGHPSNFANWSSNKSCIQEDMTLAKCIHPHGMKKAHDHMKWHIPSIGLTFCNCQDVHEL
jgi:hypothetical protein